MSNGKIKISMLPSYNKLETSPTTKYYSNKKVLTNKDLRNNCTQNGKKTRLSKEMSRKLSNNRRRREGREPPRSERTLEGGKGEEEEATGRAKEGI